jgi:hypothetical protein
MARRNTLKFILSYTDPSCGQAQWDIELDGKIVGQIEKSTSWCGDGYRADDYTVVVSVETADPEDDEREESFPCENSWNPGRMTARQALAAAKNFARELAKGRRAHPTLNAIDLRVSA